MCRRIVVWCPGVAKDILERAEREKAKLDEDTVRFVASGLESECKVSFFSCNEVCTQYHMHVLCAYMHT